MPSRHLLCQTPEAELGSRAGRGHGSVKGGAGQGEEGSPWRQGTGTGFQAQSQEGARRQRLDGDDNETITARIGEIPALHQIFCMCDLVSSLPPPYAEGLTRFSFIGGNHGHGGEGQLGSRPADPQALASHPLRRLHPNTSHSMRAPKPLKSTGGAPLRVLSAALQRSH